MKLSILSRCVRPAAYAAALLLASCATQKSITLDQPYGAEQAIRFPMSAGFVHGTDFDVRREVAPGIVHEFASNEEMPLTRNSVFIDTSKSELMLEAVKGQNSLFKRETVPDMVERISEPDRPAVVAINGDFWGDRSYPLNHVVCDGMIWRTKTGPDDENRSYFAWDVEKNYYFGQDAIKITLTGPGGSVQIDEVNFPGEFTETVAYTWPIGEEAPAPPEGWQQAVFELPGGEWVPNDPKTVTVKESAVPGTIALNRETIVFQTKNALPDWMTQGAQLRLQATIEGLPAKVAGVVGGGGVLVKDGEIHTEPKEERIAETFYSDLHPRTGLGVMPDGKTIVMVVVDGRQHGLSRGINLYEFAEYFKSIGARDAINLDGGGSSTMVVGGELVTFPSDPGGPRSVTNGIAVMREAQTGEVASLQILPANVLLPAGTSIELNIQGRDASGVAAPLDGYKTKVAVVEGEAEITPDAKLHVLQPGTVTIRAESSAKSRETATGEASFRVEKPAQVAFEPGAVLLESGDTAEVTLEASSTTGEPFFRNIVIEGIDVPPFVEYNQETRRLKGLSEGAGVITASLGGETARLPVAVEAFEQQSIDSFDKLPADNPKEWMTLLKANEKKTNLTLATDIKEEGSASWKWDYAMASGGTTKIALPLKAPIPGEPLAIGLWVYGDGQGQWLRGGLRDANGVYYYINFTSNIDWKDEWRFLRASLLDVTATKATDELLKPPLTLDEIYLVQPQEAAKRDGTIYIDGLSALDLPAGIK